MSSNTGMATNQQDRNTIRNHSTVSKGCFGFFSGHPNIPLKGKNVHSKVTYRMNEEKITMKFETNDQKSQNANPAKSFIQPVSSENGHCAPGPVTTGVNSRRSRTQSTPRLYTEDNRNLWQREQNGYGASNNLIPHENNDRKTASNMGTGNISRSERKEEEMVLEIKRLKLENEKLRSENIEKDRRSATLAQQMAQIMEIGGNFEDVSDEFSCSNITKMCGRLNNDWAFLCKNIARSNRSIAELEIIHALTALMKLCYYKCSTTAERQIRQFLLLNDTEAIPSEFQHFQQILHLRKSIGIKDLVREKITEDVFNELKKTDADTFKTLCTGVHEEMVKKKMDSFFPKFIDCCWLMAISYPSIILNFEVVGKLYVELTERWSEYPMKDPVEDMEKPVGEVVEVVWPCVERQDGSGFYAKGEVVIVKRGIIG